MKTAIMRGLALAGLFGLAMPAQATTYLVSFTISGSWSNAGNPYGVPTGQSLSGSFTADSTQSGAAAISGLSYITGSRSWTDADLDGGSGVGFSIGGITGFQLLFTAPLNYIYSNNTAQVNDGKGAYTYCNNCVNFRTQDTAVPEPGSWALIIAGLALTGTALRRRKAVAVSFA
jgi:hypothetical protein